MSRTSWALALSPFVAAVAVACSGTSDRTSLDADAGSAPARTAAAAPRAVTLARSVAAHAVAVDTLLRAPGRGFAATTTALAAGDRGGDGLTARLATVASGPLQVSVGGSDSVRLALTPLGAQDSPALLHQGRAVFEDVYPATDRVVIATPDRVEELLVFRGANSPSELTWQVDQGDDLVQVDHEPNGAYTFSSANGEPQLRIPAPFMVDAKGTERSVKAELVDGYLHVALDLSGLEYPVVLDPGVETAIWTQLSPTTSPAKRAYATLSYDSSAQVTVMFGGYSSAYLNDTWEWNGTNWNLICDTGACAPPARRQHAGAFDSARARTVIFGGRDASGAIDDTWEYNGTANTWAQGCGGSGCSTKPTARLGAAMAFDSQNGVSVLFGGLAGATAMNDTWTYNGTTWTNACTGACLTNSPPARYYHNVAYDSARHVLVMHGGQSSVGYYSDTWEWNGSSWTKRCDTGACGVGDRDFFGMTYDSRSKRTVMFGGYDYSVPTALADTWEWNGTTWSNPYPSVSTPAARSNHALAYDAARKRVVMFGSNTDNETWTYYTRGGTCSTAADCDTGNCVDGVCCTAANCGTCQRCNGAGTSRGVCSTVTNATDDTCNGTSSCDASGACKKALGQGCSGATECASALCVDGHCCATSCTTPCLSCANSAGTCSTVVASQNDDHCNGASSCDASGNCKKALGQACALASECASNFCADGHCCQSDCTAACRSCANSTGTCDTVVASQDDDHCNTNSTCDASGVCKKKLGQSCTTGAECINNFCVDGTCCSDACTTPCRSCANAAGTCTTLVTSGTDDHCNGANTCDSSGACNKALGQTCAGDTECGSGYCRDGHCCTNDCATPCRSCANAAGTCTTVVSSASDNHCSGASTCDASGACKESNGQTCSAGSDCASGFCADGYCCNSACSGACNSCDATPGTCSLKAAGSAGNPSCAPYQCTGANAACPTSCANDAQCVAARFCNTSAGTCDLDQADGATCTASSQCTSGHCVDGVCCDTACTGSCQACSVAKKGSGADGVCDNIGADLDPDNECAQDSGYPASCKADGLCNGAGACRQYAKAGTGCGSTATICNGNVVTGEICNGNGQCNQDPNGVDCTPYLCTAGACGTSCTSDSDCVATAFCAGGACQAKKGLGDSCGSTSECTSGYCADDVCCDTACNGACDVCNSTAGSCTLTSSGSPGSPSCAPYVCDGTSQTCPTTCATDSNCAAGYFCDAGTCAPKLDNGQACSLATECTSTFCVDGVCCGSACTERCAACDVSGAEGTCSPVTGAPHGTRQACTADPDCGGACDGADTADCKYTAAGKPCGTAACSNGQATASQCSGSGVCQPLAATTCAPYKCGASACNTTCQVASDCTTGYVCQNGECTPEGAICKDDFTVQEADNSLKDCNPYHCVGGTCQTTCNTSDDCATGYICDSNGKCVASPGAASPDDGGGCGCVTAGRSPAGSGSGFAALGLMLLVALRRRRRDA